MVWTVVFFVLCGAGLVWLGWISVQSLRQAWLLGSLPSGIAGVQEGQRVALRGKVRVHEPLTAAGVGPCLWVRIVEKELDSWASGLLTGRRRWRTVSDQSQVAAFSLVEREEEIALEDLPTEVQGTQSTTDSDSAGCVGQFFSEGNSLVRTEWLPVLDEATALGRIERRGERRVLVKDPELGLLLSPHPADRAALIENLKGWGGLAALAAGVVLLVLFGGTLTGGRSKGTPPPQSLAEGDSLYVVTVPTSDGRKDRSFEYHARRNCPVLEMEEQGKLVGQPGKNDVERLRCVGGRIVGQDGTPVSLRACAICAKP